MTRENSFKTILENLYHLEINTIIKENMTAQKMPPPEEALLDLAETYCKELRSHGAEITSEQVSRAKWQSIHDVAKQLLDAIPPGASDSDRSARYWLLARIRNHSGQIVKVFDAVERRGVATGAWSEDTVDEHPLELLPDEIVIIRKAWEIGLEDIVLQTVIQLDGDVVHRVKAGYETEQYRQLSVIHDHAVRTSVSFWKTMLDIVGDVLGGVLRLVGLKV